VAPELSTNAFCAARMSDVEGLDVAATHVAEAVFARDRVTMRRTPVPEHARRSVPVGDEVVAHASPLRCVDVTRHQRPLRQLLYRRIVSRGLRACAASGDTATSRTLRSKNSGADRKTSPMWRPA
jgi:hypothetical protein